VLRVTPFNSFERAASLRHVAQRRKHHSTLFNNLERFATQRLQEDVFH